MDASKRLLIPLLLGAGCGEDAWRPSESVNAALDEPGPWDVDDMVLGAIDDAESLEAGRHQAATGAPQVIYSNFSDGTTTLIKGGENAPKNVSSICGGVYGKWTGSEARAKALQNAMQSMMNDFNVIMAGKRPTTGPYSMIMVGPAGGCKYPGAGGVAPVDCGNKNPNNVCFDFSSSGSAITMGQEIAHTFGLAHNDVACDVMGASYTSKRCTTGKWGYIDLDGKILGGAYCGGTSQNSYQLMKKVLGEWPGGAHPDPMGDGATCSDAADPMLRVLEPADGAEVGSSITVKVEASDDCGLKEVRIDVPELDLHAKAGGAPPFEWTIDGLPDQPRLEIVLAAVDAAGKQTEARINVKVSSGGAGGAGGGGGEAGAGGAGGEPPGEDPGQGASRGGCGCRLGDRAGTLGGALWVAALVLCRARRRRS